MSTILRDENRVVWVLCRLRRHRVCKGCQLVVEKGDEAYRPLTNTAQRGERVCIDCAANGTCLWPLS